MPYGDFRSKVNLCVRWGGEIYYNLFGIFSFLMILLSLPETGGCWANFVSTKILSVGCFISEFSST